MVAAVMQPTFGSSGQNGGPSVRRALEASLVETFCRFGYAELEVPYLEEWETLEVAGDPQLRERAVKVLDPQGKVRVLRPDFTASVARMVAEELGSAPRPLRLFYSGTVFRRADPRRFEPEEFGQAGAELIGDLSLPGEEAEKRAGLRADFECIRVAVECLKGAGLWELFLVISHASLIPSWLQLFGLEAAQARALRSVLARHDFVELNCKLGASLSGPCRACEKAAAAGGSTILPVPRGEEAVSIALGFLKSRGGVEVVQRGRDMAYRLLEARGGHPGEAAAALLGALDELEALCRGVLESVPEVRVIVDLGLARELEYYTGMVFDVCAGDLGRPLGGGGRYDGLMARFGRNEPARGFGFRLDRLAEALSRGRRRACQGIEVTGKGAGPGC